MRLSLLASCLVAFTGPLAAQVTTTPPPPAPAATTGYGAWFGSIPNMDGSAGGILLDGTTPGSPAEKAGLKAGDWLLSIGGTRMEDLRSMVDLLRARQPGDTVEVLYQRGEAMEKVKVVLGVRPGN